MYTPNILHKVAGDFSVDSKEYQKEGVGRTRNKFGGSEGIPEEGRKKDKERVCRNPQAT
jgi:hypothetical protein